MSSFEKSIGKTKSSLKKLETSSNKTGNKIKGILGDLGKLGFKRLEGSLGDVGKILTTNLGASLGKVSVSMAGTSSAILGLSGAAAAALPALAALAATFGILRKSAQFEVNLDNLQALTGLDDTGMKSVASSAIRMSKEFGTAAGGIVDSMGLIGSQYPALLKNSKALGEVTEASIVLSKAAGIDVTEAAKGVTTVLNQMGVSAGKASDIVNVLAAGSQQGAAGVDYLNKALEKSGTAFSSAGVSYTEAIAAVEAVAPKFSSADVAGSQLASTLLKLSIQTNDQFKPAVVGFGQAIENLKNAELSDLQIKEMVGESNVNMLKTLMNSTDEYSRLTEAITGTNTAYEQMETRMDNIPGAIEKLKASWSGMILQIGQTETFQALSDGIKSLINGLSSGLGYLGNIFTPLIQSIHNVISPIMKLDSALFGTNKIIKVLGDGLKFIGDILVWVARACEVVTAVFAGFVNKVGEGVKTVWQNMGRVVKETKIYGAMQEQLRALRQWWDDSLAKIKGAWRRFKKWAKLEKLSFEGDSGLGDVVEEDTTVEKEIVVDYTLGEINLEQVDALGKMTEGVEKVFVKGSIDWYENEIKKINDELQGTIVSEERLAELMTKKADYAKELLNLQLKYGLVKKDEVKQQEQEASITADPNSYRGITERLSNLNSELDLEIYGSENYWKLVKSIKELTEKKLKIELQMDEDLLSEADRKVRAIEASIERTETIGDDLGSVMNSVSSVFSSFASSAKNGNEKVAKSIAVISQGITDMIPHIITLITAKQAEAISSGSASAAKLPYPANIAHGLQF
jgi:TP901 family phage tail tape measure protein